MSTMRDRKQARKIGAAMADSSIYAGVSPNTGKPMHTTPEDAPFTGTFNEAARYAATLDAHGHKDWRVPSKAELDLLFKNRTAIGNFNTSGSAAEGCYWSSSQDFTTNAWSQRFSDGSRFYYHWSNPASLRCVRG